MTYVRHKFEHAMNVLYRNDDRLEDHLSVERFQSCREKITLGKYNNNKALYSLFY